MILMVIHTLILTLIHMVDLAMTHIIQSPTKLDM